MNFDTRDSIVDRQCLQRVHRWKLRSVFQHHRRNDGTDGGHLAAWEARVTAPFKPLVGIISLAGSLARKSELQHHGREARGEEHAAQAGIGACDRALR